MAGKIAPPAIEEMQMTHPTSRTTQLLLVDDDPSMIRLLTTVLKREFHDDIEIVALEHSQAAMQWMQHHGVGSNRLPAQTLGPNGTA